MPVSARLYITVKGIEIDHPAQGAPFLGHGAYIAKRGSVVFVDRIECKVKGTTVMLMPKHFDGPVMVKLWYSPDEFEMCAFCSLDKAIEVGATATGYDSEHIQECGENVAFQGWSSYSKVIAA